MDFNTHYIKNGLYAGLACSLIYLASHAVDPSFYIKQSKVFGGLILILFLVKSSKVERMALGGYASFGELIKVNFICYTIAALLISIFTYILYNNIDPNLANLELEIVGEVLTKVFDFFGTPADLVDESIASIDEIGYQKDFFTILTDFIGKLFNGIILSLIVAAIFKKSSAV